MTREEAIDVLKHNYPSACFTDLCEAVEIAIKALSEQPERKKGKWIWLSSTYDRTPCEMRYWCSECHHETILHSNEMSHPWEKFCPNCGAKMED